MLGRVAGAQVELLKGLSAQTDAERSKRGNMKRSREQALQERMQRIKAKKAKARPARTHQGATVGKERHCMRVARALSSSPPTHALGGGYRNVESTMRSLLFSVARGGFANLRQLVPVARGTKRLDFLYAMPEAVARLAAVSELQNCSRLRAAPWA